MHRHIKPILFCLLLIAISSFSIMHFAFADQCSGVETNLISCDGGGDAGIWHVILLIIDILTIGIGILAMIGISISGIQYLTAAGDENKTRTSKRRIFEIVIGLAFFVLSWSILNWLLPGGKFSAPNDIKSISVSLSESTIETGKGTNVEIKFDSDDIQDKTYSLSSSDPKVATTTSNTVRCVSAGKATITATSVNGKTATTKITCKEPEPPKEEPSDSGSGSGSNPGTGPKPENTWFTCDDCTSRAKSKEFDKAFSSEKNSITYEKAKQLAKNKGISEDNFYAIVAWARTENYENLGYGDYFAYLCTSTMVNKALNGNNLLSEMNSWATDGTWFYSYAKFLGSHSSSHCQKDEIHGTGQTVCGYYDSNIKIVYMALKNTYPKVTSCYGGRPNNVVTYQNGIYIGW